MPDRADTSPAPGIDRATVRHDEAGGFYEVLVDGASAGLLVYGLEGSRRVFTHVYINEEYRGNSLSTLLVRAALDDIRAAGGTVTNYCPVVGRFVDHHSEYQATIDSANPGRWRRSNAARATWPTRRSR
jgi:predicted GNAT family acetyltransferase